MGSLTARDNLLLVLLLALSLLGPGDLLGVPATQKMKQG